MKHHISLSFVLSVLFVHYATAADNIRAIFLFKDVMKSDIAALKTSGFNTLIIFGIGILDNGDMKYYSNTPGIQDALVVSKGVYIGGTALAEKVRSLKTGNETDVNRLEISMNSQHVKNLISKPGPGAGTPHFQNFEALKTGWSLDAVNNDDEPLYDVTSTVSFAKMLAKIGYKYTIAQYTNTKFSQSVTRQLNTGLTESNLVMD